MRIYTLTVIVGILAIGGLVWYQAGPEFRKAFLPASDKEMSLSVLSKESNSPTKPPSALGLTTNGNPGINITADTAVVMDSHTGRTLYQLDSTERRSVASLTKLMTALVFLETKPDWGKTTSMLPEEYLIGGKLNAGFDEEIYVRDLFAVSLIGSANNTTLAMVRTTGLSQEEFVKRMNNKARDLGLPNTHFTDVTGLDPANKSTTYEIAKLARTAFANPEIRKVTTMSEYTFAIANNGREHTVKNTNRLVRDYPEKQFLGSKTGYLDEAGYCLAVQVKNERGEDHVIVVLDSPAKEWHFQDILTLMKI